MIFYHRTPAPDAVIADGFRDGEGAYGTRYWWTGVWISDIPLDINEGASGDALLAIEIPEEVVAEFEWVQEPSFGYREFLVPAAVVNRYGPPRRVTSEEEEDIWARGFGQAD